MTNPITNHAPCRHSLITLLIFAHLFFMPNVDCSTTLTTDAHGRPAGSRPSTNGAQLHHLHNDMVSPMDNSMQINSPSTAPNRALLSSPSSSSVNGENLPYGMMRISMKHRDAHPVHRNQSKSESLHHAMRRDSARISRHHHHRHHYSHRRRSHVHMGSTSAISATTVSEMSPSMPARKTMSSPVKKMASPGTLATATTSPVLAPLTSSNYTSNSSTTTIQSSVVSGVSLGSGEYFMDVHMGTPPRHFSLIVDTGSDLIWTQCSPCNTCYSQQGPIFSPKTSSSYELVTCSHPMCSLVNHGDDSYNKSITCTFDTPADTCKYIYTYGDKSSTIGDLALETITLSLVDGQPVNLDAIVFGCGHYNEGLFLGAGGLLGLGKGPLSFPSQMHKRFGHRKFSYCLVDRNNNLSVSSTLVFGEDTSLAYHPQVQYTQFVTNTSLDTFYYLGIKMVLVGGEVVDLPSDSWVINDSQGKHGTIIDSGTTLTYFAKEPFERIVLAFDAQISYPRVESSILNYCYNVSGHAMVEFPTFSLVFVDGAIFTPPFENYFIGIDLNSEPILCLAMLEAPSTSPSILGNYFQQNTHLLYDLDNNKLGFVPMECKSMGN